MRNWALSRFVAACRSPQSIVLSFQKLAGTAAIRICRVIDVSRQHQVRRSFRHANLAGPCVDSETPCRGWFLAIVFGDRPAGSVISNDADRFKRFYFFCPRTHLSHGTRIASLWLPCSLVSPQPARAVSASSIRCCPPNISSVTIDHDELCDLPGGRRVA